MKKTILLLVVILSLFESASGQFRNRRNNKDNSTDQVDYSQQREYEISGIKVIGVKVLDENALISLTGLKIGDRIKVPGDEISGAIRKLWKHGLVGDVSIYIKNTELGKVDIIIELAERPRLTGFTFEGVTKSKESDIREDLNLIRGRVLSDAIVRNAEITVKKYYIEKGFLNTEVNIIREMDSLSSDGVRLRIVVDKKGKVKIKNINFEGNEEISEIKLKQKMKSTNEKVRFTLPDAIADAAFSFRFSKAKEFFQNKHEASWRDVGEFIARHAKLNFFNSSKFIVKDYEVDKKALITHYNSKGYRDAEVVVDTIYTSGKSKIDIDIKVDEGVKYYFRNIDWKGNYVHTDETLNKILDIEKGDVYDMELINRKLSFNPKGADISGLYMDNGYLFFSVTPVEVGIVGDSIDVEMRIFEGEQATINKILITGNDRTNDHVILRELTTLPGQKFSRAEIIRSQQRLAQLGYFDAEQISPTPLPNMADGTVDIEWSVVERPSDQIQLSGGWGGNFGFVGTLGLTFNNFSLKNIPHLDKWRPLPIGDGQRLSISAQANGRQYQSYNFSFTEPWLGGRKPNSLTVSFNHSVQRRAFSEDLNLDGDYLDPNESRSFTDFNSTLKLTGVTLGLGRRLQWPDNYFTLQNSISYFLYRLNNYNGGLGFTDGKANSFTFNTTLSRNNIDNPMFPTMGSTISLNVALTPPYSSFKGKEHWKLSDAEKQNITDEITNSASPDANPDALENKILSTISNTENAERYRLLEYHKWMFDAKYYLTLAGKLVLESRVHFGYIGSYGSQEDIGPFERFYLGGDGLAGQNFLLGTEIIGMRGYENNSIVPPFSSAEIKPGTPSGIRGGIVYNKLSFELRYPITTGQAATIYAFGFGEAGNNWFNYEDVNPFNLYRSAGLGARIFMPAFGLIGLNWGYGFDKLPGSNEVSGPQFHFTIGQQLR